MLQLVIGLQSNPNKKKVTLEHHYDGIMPFFLNNIPAPVDVQFLRGNIPFGLECYVFPNFGFLFQVNLFNQREN